MSGQEAPEPIPSTSPSPLRSSRHVKASSRQPAAALAENIQRSCEVTLLILETQVSAALPS